MDIQTFITNYQEAFGEKAILPILFYYSDAPIAKTEKINGCFFKGIASVREGNSISLNADIIGCGGGKLYTSYAPMNDYIPGFVSQKEKYKQTPQQVIDYVASLDLQSFTGKWLNFIRIDQAKSFEGMEGLLFLAPPDMLSGLTTWAYFDNEREDAVCAIFGSGCSAVVSQAVRENRIGGHRTFLGLFDPSVRPYVGAYELSFVIPANRFTSMMKTMRECCLFGTHAWNKVRARINE